MNDIIATDTRSNPAQEVLVAYFAGLAIAQTSMLLVVSLISERFIKMIGISWTKILAGIWMGIGFAFAWSVVIP